MTFTTEEMSETHVPDDHIKLPECTAITDNYFVHEGLYFTEWLPDDIGDIYGGRLTRRRQEAGEVMPQGVV